MYNFIYLRWIY